ncbi:MULTISPECIES: hypothetical protein [unclassified Microbacterium]|uniref:hypothetical protein n=1 Tax=unclassified Microbacterium TaxID=2609290 RepID=UPI00301A466B
MSDDIWMPPPAHHYRGASSEFVTEIGLLTLAAGTLEDTIYVLAEELQIEHEDIRRSAASTATKTISRGLDTKGVPQWAGQDVTPEVVKEWLRDVGDVLEERNGIVHALTYMKKDDEQWTRVVRRGIRKTRVESPGSAEGVRDVRERIDTLIERGTYLTLGVMPQLAPDIYLSFLGGRGRVVVGDENGYPDIATPDRLAARENRVVDFWQGFMERGIAPVAYVPSPAGTRIVPRWFSEPF